MPTPSVTRNINRVVRMDAEKTARETIIMNNPLLELVKTTVSRIIATSGKAK